MRLWRISAFPGLSGAGGNYASGRWHIMPRPVLYVAEHPALALLEVLAHMQLDPAHVPTTLKLLSIDVAKGAKRIKAPVLPAGWQANEPTSQAVGNAFLEAGNALLMPVPSALVPHAINYVINPRHAQAATHLTETNHGPIWIDPRFIR